MKTPFLLIIDGMTGAGKTTASKILAERIPRMAVVGMDKVKRFVSDFERGERDNQIARDIVFLMTEKYFELGLSVLVEQPFKSDEELQRYEELAQKYSIPVHKIQLFTTPEIAMERVMFRQKNFEYKCSEERVKRNIGLFKNKEQQGFTVIDTSNIPSLELVDKIIKTINC